MKYLDVINACFEAVGAVMIWLNFRRLLRDRVVRGVDWRVTGFYSAWGLWNLVYYSGVGHWLSCAACVGITAGNISWLVLALRCMDEERRKEAAVAAIVAEVKAAMNETAEQTHRRHDYEHRGRARCACSTCKSVRS